MDDYKELLEWLRDPYQYEKPIAYAIESLLAENERLKHNLTTTEQTMREYQELAAKRLEEIAKYRDAPVVAYLYKYRNCFGDEVWTTNHNWGNRIPFESKPLIVKPGEMK